MSIASEITRLQNDSDAIASAIEAKGVTVPSGSGFDDYATLIASIPSGGGSNFDDWVDDNDTHLWINIVLDSQKAQSIRIRMIGTIDWGDGSAKDTANVTTYTTFTHTYSELGKYRIDLHPTSGTFYLGGGSNSYTIMGSRTTGRYYTIGVLYQAQVGKSIITTLSSYAFYYCLGLKRVYIPKNITTVGSYTFSQCLSLKEVICEKGINITSTDLSNVFYNCYNLLDVSTLNTPSLESLSATFRYCYSLYEYTIPAPVTSIGANTFPALYSIRKLHCLPTTAPTVANANAFTDFRSSCVIEVPFGSLSSYQGASTWSNYASNMVEAGAITYTLSHVSSSNMTYMVSSGESYTTELQADDGYTLGTVTVKMGGTDITSTAYSAGVVTIASVTGNIIITASAS